MDAGLDAPATEDGSISEPTDSPDPVDVGPALDASDAPAPSTVVVEVVGDPSGTPVPSALVVFHDADGTNPRVIRTDSTGRSIEAVARGTEVVVSVIETSAAGTRVSTYTHLTAGVRVRHRVFEEAVVPPDPWTYDLVVEPVAGAIEYRVEVVGELGCTSPLFSDSFLAGTLECDGGGDLFLLAFADRTNTDLVAYRVARAVGPDAPPSFGAWQRDVASVRVTTSLSGANISVYPMGAPPAYSPLRGDDVIELVPASSYYLAFGQSAPPVRRSRVWAFTTLPAVLDVAVTDFPSPPAPTVDWSIERRPRVAWPRDESDGLMVVSLGSSRVGYVLFAPADAVEATVPELPASLSSLAPSYADGEMMGAVQRGTSAADYAALLRGDFTNEPTHSSTGFTMRAP